MERAIIRFTGEIILKYDEKSAEFILKLEELRSKEPERIKEDLLIEMAGEIMEDPFLYRKIVDTQDIEYSIESINQIE